MSHQWPPIYDSTYVPSNNSEYWNEEIETMDPGEREKLIAIKLKNQVEWAHQHSGFYQKVWGEAGFDPSQLKTIDDIKKRIYFAHAF